MIRPGFYILFFTLPLTIFAQSNYIDRLLRQTGENINRQMQDVQDDINLRLFGERRRPPKEEPSRTVAMEKGTGLGQWIWEDAQVHDNPNMPDSRYVSIISEPMPESPQMRVYAILTGQGVAFMQAYLVFSVRQNPASPQNQIEIVAQFDHMPVFKEVLSRVHNGEHATFRFDNATGYATARADKKSFPWVLMQSQVLQLWAADKPLATFKTAGLEDMVKEALRAMIASYGLDKRAATVLEEYITRANQEIES